MTPLGVRNGKGKQRLSQEYMSIGRRDILIYPKERRERGGQGNPEFLLECLGTWWCHL